MFLGLVKEILRIKKNQLRDSASCGIEIQCNSFPTYYLEV